MAKKRKGILKRAIRKVVTPAAAPALEYRVRQFPVNQNAKDLEALLNSPELGPKGWQLICVTITADDMYSAFFYRVSSPSNPPAEEI